METNKYCWEVSVFFGKNPTPVQTVEIYGHRTEIMCYIQYFEECDRFEATPKPVECMTDKSFVYDPEPYQAMKMSGPLGVVVWWVAKHKVSEMYQMTLFLYHDALHSLTKF